MPETPSVRFFVAEATIPSWLDESNHHLIISNMARYLRDKATTEGLNPAKAHVTQHPIGDSVMLTVMVGAVSYAENTPDAAR